MEVINPVLFERNRSRSTGDVLDAGRHQSLVRKLELMTFEDLMKPRRVDDPEKRPLVLWILGDFECSILQSTARRSKKNAPQDRHSSATRFVSEIGQRGFDLLGALTGFSSRSTTSSNSAGNSSPISLPI